MCFCKKQRIQGAWSFYQMIRPCTFFALRIKKHLLKFLNVGDKARHKTELSLKLHRVEGEANCSILVVWSIQYFVMMHF